MTKQFPIHPLCNSVPSSTEKEYEELLQDMKTNGFDTRFPIVLFDGMILDGRHRARAAQELGLEPTTVEWTPKGDDTPAKFILRAQRRRSLTAGQRAALAVQLLPKLEEEAAAKQKTGKSDLGDSLYPRSRAPKSTAVAAQEVGASEVYVKEAKKIQSEDHEVFAKVASGEMTIPVAKAEVQAKKGPPPVPKTHCDKAGNIIEGDLVEVFAAASIYEQLTKDIRTVKDKILELAAQPLGASINVSAVETIAKDLASALKWGRPFAKCPYKTCVSGKCKACGGRRWVTESRWINVPKDLKGGTQ